MSCFSGCFLNKPREEYLDALTTFKSNVSYGRTEISEYCEAYQEFFDYFDIDDLPTWFLTMYEDVYNEVLYDPVTVHESSIKSSYAALSDYQNEAEEELYIEATLIYNKYTKCMDEIVDAQTAEHLKIADHIKSIKNQVNSLKDAISTFGTTLDSYK